MKILRISAQKILNSRGEPTIKVTVNNSWGAAPSGASKGKYEIKDYTKGIDSTVRSVDAALKKFIRLDFSRFEDLRKFEPKLLNFGANPTVAFELALLSAWAKDEGKPLWRLLNPKAKKMPRILANVVGGGAHYKGKSIDIQEILLSPNTKSVAKDVALTSLFHKELSWALGTKTETDEGAWVAPEHLKFDAIFDTVFSASGYERGIDMAASHLFEGERYHWKNFWGRAKSFSAKQQKDIIRALIEEYGLFYVEDPLAEDDFKGFAELRRKFPDVMISGDDLTATNLSRLKKAIKMKSINAIIIKPNQVGSLLKTKQVFDHAVREGITPVVSHRSGETMDTTIAHLAFAWQAPFVKFGIAQKERMAKLNELIKIELSVL